MWGYCPAGPAGCASSRQPCAVGTLPTGTARGTGRWWSSPARTDSDPGPRRSDRGRTRAARCESRPGRNRHRSASRAIRWRRPVWSAPPGSRIPCGRAWRRANAGTLRYRGGFRGRSTGRTPSIGTDPSRRSCAICDPRRSGLRSGGTHDPGRKLINCANTVRPRFMNHCRPPPKSFQPSFAVQIAAKEKTALSHAGTVSCRPPVNR